jgi:hypothetical protein
MLKPEIGPRCASPVPPNSQIEGFPGAALFHSYQQHIDFGPMAQFDHQENRRSHPQEVTVAMFPYAPAIAWAQALFRAVKESFILWR